MVSTLACARPVVSTCMRRGWKRRVEASQTVRSTWSIDGSSTWSRGQ